MEEVRGHTFFFAQMQSVFHLFSLLFQLAAVSFLLGGATSINKDIAASLKGNPFPQKAFEEEDPLHNDPLNSKGMGAEPRSHVVFKTCPWEDKIKL